MARWSACTIRCGRAWSITWGEFIRKRDYRYSQETISEEETAAVERSIETLTGAYPRVS
jgi:hypothetical protein